MYKYYFHIKKREHHIRQVNRLANFTEEVKTRAIRCPCTMENGRHYGRLSLYDCVQCSLTNSLGRKIPHLNPYHLNNNVLPQLRPKVTTTGFLWTVLFIYLFFLKVWNGTILTAVILASLLIVLFQFNRNSATKTRAIGFAVSVVISGYFTQSLKSAHIERSNV